MSSLQLVRPVVGRRIVIELPEEWSNVEAVDVTVSPHQVDQSGEAPSPLYQALESIGFVGCISTDEQLSTTYKQKLDFSGKCGARQ